MKEGANHQSSSSGKEKESPAKLGGPKFSKRSRIPDSERFPQLATVLRYGPIRIPFPRGDQTRTTGTRDFFSSLFLLSNRLHYWEENSPPPKKHHPTLLRFTLYPQRSRSSHRSKKVALTACCDGRAGISLHPPIRRPANSWRAV